MKTIYVANPNGILEVIEEKYVEGINNWEELNLEGVDVPESIVKYYGCEDGIGKVIFREDVDGDILEDVNYVDEQLF